MQGLFHPPLMPSARELNNITEGRVVVIGQDGYQFALIRGSVVVWEQIKGPEQGLASVSYPFGVQLTESPWPALKRGIVDNINRV